MDINVSGISNLQHPHTLTRFGKINETIPATPKTSRPKTRRRTTTNSGKRRKPMPQAGKNDHFPILKSPCPHLLSDADHRSRQQEDPDNDRFFNFRSREKSSEPQRIPTYQDPY